MMHRRPAEGEEYTCTDPFVPTFHPRTRFPRTRRIVELDTPCSDTSDDGEEATHDPPSVECRRAIADVSQTVADREREEMLRRTHMREERGEGENSNLRLHELTPPPTCLPSITVPCNEEAVKRVTEFALRRACPLRSTLFRKCGASMRDLHDACMDVVRILPGWYIHRDFCSCAADASRILLFISSRYNSLSWEATLSRRAVRPMLGTVGVLQNLQGRTHAAAAFAYMMRRNSASQPMVRELKIPDHIRNAALEIADRANENAISSSANPIRIESR